MEISKPEQNSSLLSISLSEPSVELSKIINSATDGRYVISIEGGKLVGATRVADHVCIIDPNDGEQMAAVLRFHVPLSVWHGDDMGTLVVDRFDDLCPAHRDCEGRDFIPVRGAEMMAEAARAAYRAR